MNGDEKQFTIQNASSYKFLAIISMIYMSIMLVNAVLTDRYVGSDVFFVLGGTLTSPFVFILDDIIAEIYGYKMARCVIFCGFAAQTLFVVICQLVVLAPSPSFSKESTAYFHILGPSLLRIHFSGFAAYIMANLMNSYVITRWKILLKGKKFWLRSVGSSMFSEAFYSLLAIILMELNSIPFHEVIKVVMISYTIKVLYNIIFAAPANALVKYIKNKTGMDVYDFPQSFTPFKYFKLKKENQYD